MIQMEKINLLIRKTYPFAKCFKEEIEYQSTFIKLSLRCHGANHGHKLYGQD